MIELWVNWQRQNPSSSPTQNCWVDVGRGAGEQGSRGEAYTKFFPLCPSANHHAKFPWQTTSDIRLSLL
ncbi:MAG: hypothetical protein V7L23_04235 [Nostoc sp.]|uniref:hypothetical protein n=1 Tax=Nostoc sp. TaxID=1180 RepID=UPI002FEE84F9